MKKVKKHWIFIAVLTAAMVLIPTACENPSGPNRGTGGENPDPAPTVDPNIGKDGLTPATAWVVYNVETLTAVGKAPAGYEAWTLDKHYIQIDDIDLTGEPNWTRIGTPSPSNGFTGSYDGGNYTITGLTISQSGVTHQGMFGYIEGASALVKNVRLVGVSITGGNNTGGVVGQNNNSTVQNCSVSGAVSGGIYTGGVVGINGYPATVQNCSVSGAVSGGTYTGGVVGANNVGKVQNCYATGAVEGTGTTGGVVGQNSSGTVQNCYATGDVSSNDFIGGVAGYNSGGTVQNCVALSESVTGTGSNVGRVLGSGSTTNNYAWSDMTVNGSTIGGTPAANSINGANIGTGEFNTEGWWKTAAPGGPGWTINAAGSGSEASPWEWNSTNNLPKLWFE